MIQIDLFSKPSFSIIGKIWYLNYLLHQMPLLNLKSHPTMIILSLRTEFSEISPEKILNILKGLNSCKAAEIHNLSGKFLKDVTDILARPMSQPCNLSIKLNLFPRICKVAKKGFLKRLQN